MVEGNEEAEVFQIIVESIQAPDDYEVYESTHNALWKFPPDKFAQYFVPLLPEFITRMAQYDQVGRFLCPLVGWAEKDYLPLFNQELAKLSKQNLHTIMDFVYDNAEEGWFEDSKNKIHPV